MDEKKVREAIEFLQRQICTLDAQKEYDEYGQPLYNETFDIVIDIYETALKALEKQLPKKPIEDDEQHIRYVTDYVCPNCNGNFTGTISKYCYHCGQKLDWSE